MAKRPPLPIDPLLPQVVETLRSASSLVLEAPPGAGKTTRVPLALLEAGVVGDQEILVLQPRRLATRLAAQRVASELGEAVGGRVGYSVRFEEVSGPKTRLRFLTEGILTRRLLGDPSLKGVGAVILDEFHERHLAGDLAIALLRRLQRASRPDLKLLVMSATLAGDEVAAWLGGAPLLRSEGRVFPVEIIHRDRPDDRPLDQQIAGAVRRVLQDDGASGDLLVFLPGAGEIRRAGEALHDFAASKGLELLPLHGDLSPAAQDRAVARSSRRKVILSTNVAETSVTIEGIGVVIDSGLARIAGHSPWSGLPTLEVAKISEASAIQRAGRAGRTREGKVFRLYDRLDFEGRAQRDVPEIHRLDLAELLLAVRSAGVEDPRAFEWFEPPHPAALEAAEDLLLRLSAIDAEGGLTELGAALARLPTHPRLGRIALEGARRGVGRQACLVAALIAERDIRQERRSFSQGRSRGAGVGPSDLLALLDLFEDAEKARFAPQRLRALGLDPRAVEAVARAGKQLERSMARSIAGQYVAQGAAGQHVAQGAAERHVAQGAAEQHVAQGAAEQGAAERHSAPSLSREEQEEALLLSVLAGFPDRVARRRAPNSDELVLSGGGSASLSEASVVHHAPFVVAVAAQERGAQRGGGRIRLASAIEPEWLLDLFPEAIEEHEEWLWNEGAERVDRLSQLRYGAVVIEESREPAKPSPETAKVLAKAATSRGLAAFAGEGAVEAFFERLRLGKEALPEAGFPELSVDALDDALAAACEDLRSFAELRDASILDRLQANLGPEEQRLLATELPLRITLPSGRTLRVHYEEGRPPWIESRLQDFFGMERGPAIAKGRVPLTIHLLAPNQRAVQVTSDLAGFWERHYPTLRKALSRRYPRHAWPEDGRTAAPPPQRGRR